MPNPSPSPSPAPTSKGPGLSSEDDTRSEAAFSQGFAEGVRAGEKRALRKIERLRAEEEMVLREQEVMQ